LGYILTGGLDTENGNQSTCQVIINNMKIGKLLLLPKVEKFMKYSVHQADTTTKQVRYNNDKLICAFHTDAEQKRQLGFGVYARV
jgi:hypothetical protein